MLLTLWVNALKSRLGPVGQGLISSGTASGGGGKGLSLLDVPKIARDELGLSGLVVGTDLLAGADRAALGRLHEAADKAHCPILVLAETNPLPLASDDPKVVEKALERCYRVAQAANWLQCAAFSIRVSCRDEDDIAEAAGNLKQVSRRSEKLELNLCIAPGEDATASAENVTELLKKIGGFRVGTLPDMSAAIESPDPILYMKRLAPYASAVIVCAEDLTGQPRVIKKRAAGPAKASAKAVAKPKGKGKKTAAESVEAAITAEVPAEAAKAATPAVPDASIIDLCKTLTAVGYEQSIALDYRSAGDPMPHLLAARDALSKHLGMNQPEEEDDPLLGLLAGDLEVPDEEEKA